MCAVFITHWRMEDVWVRGDIFQISEKLKSLIAPLGQVGCTWGPRRPRCTWGHERPMQHLYVLTSKSYEVFVSFSFPSMHLPYNTTQQMLVSSNYSTVASAGVGVTIILDIVINVLIMTTLEIALFSLILYT